MSTEALGVIETKLALMGLTLPVVPAPLAAYVPATQSGNLVFTAGQLPFVDGTLLATGPVGEGEYFVDIETGKAAAARAVLNALAAVKTVTGDLDRIVKVVKMTGFIACSPEFTSHAAVMNGASELLLEIFGEPGKHARSAVGMTSLPLNAPVELELVVEVR